MKRVIKDVKVFCTAPEKVNLVIVKVETEDPQLYGFGCATFAHRHLAVVTVIEKYLKPLLLGRNAADIEDIWQTVMGSAYWRNGPVLNNALAGIDMALWDIKGRMAKMPLYELFGGRCRMGVPCYSHADGSTVEETVESVRKLRDNGYHYIRAQVGMYGGKENRQKSPENTFPGAYYDPEEYMRQTLRLFKRLREEFGDSLEFCHDVHERLNCAQAIRLAKKLEPYDLYFLEDALPLERLSSYKRLRMQTIVPQAAGELFNNPREWTRLIQNEEIDFIRVHISQIGGITPARKLMAFCEAYGVRIVWHGPVDMTPIGHAVNTHLNLCAVNLGLQEWTDSRLGGLEGMNYQLMQKIFPGMPECRDGYVYVSDTPGIGVEFDEALAEQYPCEENAVMWDWMFSRLPDGTAVRP